MAIHLEPFHSTCPACKAFVFVEEGVCPDCGFPFACDVEQDGETIVKRTSSFLSRILIVTALMAMLVYFTSYSYTSVEGYTTKTIAELEREGIAPLSIPTYGTEDFNERVQLALTLLERRAPSFFARLKRNVSSISYVPQEKLELNGRRIYLTGVSAYIDPVTGALRVRASGAYLSGLGELYDRDVFYLAGVLVHEMRHRELYKSGLNVGGLAEEFEAESTAYDALTQMGAPRSLTYSLWQFLTNPNHPRYKGWEKYYRQYR